MSLEAIDEFMSWLDCMLEEYEYSDSFTYDELEHENRLGKIESLRMVERKAKELGFITPQYRGHNLEYKPKELEE